MLLCVLLVVSGMGVLGGKSPNADYIDNMFKDSDIKYSDDVMEDAKLDVEDLVTKYRYPIESYTVATEDDYILTLHRIPHGRDRNNQAGNKTVVFLMHGLLASSSCFMIQGPNRSLAYILADEGYDVWLGNARGTYYSRRHKKLDPNSNKAFWKFSWDEIGNYDLPASLDFIERVTGQSQLHYIGHSQGTTTFLVLTALRPEYNRRFISFQGLAPVAYFKNNRDSITKLARLAGIIEPIFFGIATGEVFKDIGFCIWFTSNLCFKGSFFTPMCETFTALGSSATYNQTLVPVFNGHIPAGASIRQFVHYAQSMNANTFRRFDHSTLINLALYGSGDPPPYNMSLVTTPSYLYTAVNDSLASPKDIQLLATELGNVVKVVPVDSPAFDHTDYFWGKRAKELVYDNVVLYLKQAERSYFGKN